MIGVQLKQLHLGGNSLIKVSEYTKLSQISGTHLLWDAVQEMRQNKNLHKLSKDYKTSRSVSCERKYSTSFWLLWNLGATNSTGRYFDWDRGSQLARSGGELQTWYFLQWLKKSLKKQKCFCVQSGKFHIDAKRFSLQLDEAHLTGLCCTLAGS